MSVRLKDNLKIVSENKVMFFFFFFYKLGVYVL